MGAQGPVLVGELGGRIVGPRLLGPVQGEWWCCDAEHQKNAAECCKLFVDVHRMDAVGLAGVCGGRKRQ